MTIDEDIKMLEYIKKDFPHCRQGIALEGAIFIMQKWQKIQKIYNSWRTGDYKSSTECMEEIGEVFKDGNDD